MRVSGLALASPGLRTSAAAPRAGRVHMTASVSLLIVDEGGRLAGELTSHAGARGVRVSIARTVDEAVDAARTETFDAALVDPGDGADAGLDAVRLLKATSPDTEIIVVSGTTSLTSAIRSYELAAFAFVQRPVDVPQLFATIDRALERRRMTLHNRRLLWELQTINEIAEGISRSLELETILSGALQRLVKAFDAVAGSIRLRNDATGLYENRAYVGHTRAQLAWGGPHPIIGRPSDTVIATRAAVLVDDLCEVVAPEVAPRLPIRSAVSVPMFAGDELVGTLTVAAARPGRFDLADQRLLAIIAGQIQIAVQNARLHHSVRRGKREWERTFDAIGDPIAVFDRDAILLRGNRALAGFLGRPVTELPSASCREIGFCGGDCPTCAVGRALTDDAASAADITRPDGQIFRVTTFPVAGSDGASVVQVAKNVTEQIRSARQLQQMSDELALANAQLLAALDQLKSTQAQLLQAEKLSAIGQLVAGVAHELNNPLTSVIGYAQLLEEELLEDPAPVEARPAAELAQDLRRIAEESERAAKIVRNLLAFARRQTAARVPQDVADLVGRVLSLRSYDLRVNDVKLVTEFEYGLPQVVADGGQLQQALLNLILNAEQAMRGHPDRRMTVGARADADTGAVEIFVSDTGHGIDPANLSRIFDPFFTTRDVGEGTGLGLSICYGIIRDHGGEIAVESRVQAGTTFRLRLPALVGGPHGDAAGILIAHPDQGDREFLAAALAAWGYRPLTASRADEALAHYRRGGLQAALVDRALVAPQLAAWTAARAAAGESAPFILLAVPGGDDEVERFGREQATAVLTAPFGLRALRSAIRSIETAKEYA